jgi:Domain of unknown function (DUF4349)
MRKLLLAMVALTAGCGSQADRRAANDLHMFNVEEPPPPPALAFAPPRGEDGDARQASVEAPPVAPQIAYSYTLGYRLAADRIAAVQQSHVALCDRLGAARCHIAAMTRSAGPDGGVQAALTLVVEARLARAFEDRLDGAVAGAGGRASDRGVEAEDLSKQIVDTAAKVRGKEALTARLLILLQKRDGKVGELVEAERAYAQAQEELDGARSWLVEMRGRVAMSKIDISYDGAAPAVDSARKPLRDALAAAGEVLGASAARLLTFLVAALPWALALALVAWLLRRRGWRLRLPRPRRAPSP